MKTLTFDYILGLEERRSVSLEGLTPRQQELAARMLALLQEFAQEE